ncbi:MAG TPA: hypothetical protein VNZ85_14610 [Caulobacter sp.]|nr:hypothetical protein [Caulobacter sp.]
MPTVIAVAPAGDAWAVGCPEFENPMIFKSGARAEAAARWLAQRFNRAGRTCLLELRLRNGDLAGRFLCPAEGRDEPQSRAA